MNMKQALVAIVFALMLALPVVGSTSADATTDLTTVASLNSVTGSSSMMDISETIQLQVAESLNSRRATANEKLDTNHSSADVYRGSGYLQPGIEVFGSSTAPDAGVATLGLLSVTPNVIPKPTTALVMVLGLGGLGVIGHTRRASHPAASR